MFRFRKVPRGTSSGCRLGSRTGITGNGVAVFSARGLPAEADLDLAVLPAADAGGAEQHDQRPAGGERGLQLRLPGLAAGEGVAVEEGFQAGVGESGA